MAARWRYRHGKGWEREEWKAKGHVKGWEEKLGECREKDEKDAKGREEEIGYTFGRLRTGNKRAGR